MTFDSIFGRLPDAPVDTLVIFVSQFSNITHSELRELDVASSKAVSTLLKSQEFSGKEGEIATIFSPVNYKAKRVILAGLGDRNKIDADNYRRVSGILSRYKTIKLSTSAAFVLLGSENPQFYKAVVEGLILGGYQLLEYKSKKDPKEASRLTSISFILKSRSKQRAIQAAIDQGQIIAEGQILVRRLAFMPANALTPKLLAKEAMNLAKQHKISCRVLDEKAIAKEKMGALLGVAQGSAEPPRFIILEYKGGRAGVKPVVLIGKGVTFDSGGLSLKEPANMPEMKGDMAGAAVMLAAIVTAARLRLKLNLVTLIPTTENMPSGTATRPSDVLTTRKGLTVEITNTDAEGRLILADALDYANTFKPQAVIDIATLTGAALYILGYAGAPVLGNHPGLIQRVTQASKATAEKVWQLPIWDEHREQMKSPIADLKNSGGRPAGTIAAAAFLENFVGEWPWLHIDIAYVDLEPDGKPYVPKGASGFGLRLVVEMLANWKKLS